MMLGPLLRATLAFVLEYSRQWASAYLQLLGADLEPDGTALKGWVKESVGILSRSNKICACASITVQLFHPC